MSRRVPAVLAAALLLAGCKHDVAREERPRIEARMQEYSARLLAADPAAIAALFTPEGEMVNPRQAPVHGRAAIEKFLASYADYHLLSNQDTTDSIGVDNDTAELIGTYAQKVRSPDGHIFEAKGRLEVNWAKVNGEWLIVQLETFPAK